MTVTFELARLRGWAPPAPVATAEHTPLTHSVATPWEAYRERQLEDDGATPTEQLIRDTVHPADAEADKRLAAGRRAVLAAAVYTPQSRRQP